MLVVPVLENGTSMQNTIYKELVTLARCVSY